MSSVVRLLPFATGDGPLNMATDEALLASAVNGVASFRCYAWSTATLSLGYFQSAGPARAKPELSGLPSVRRPSGGSALVHHHELTYSLALPADQARQCPSADWIWYFHDIIRAALIELGVETHLCRQEERFAEVLCFLHHTRGDLLFTSCKVAGSAQRKRRGALLQHGGILLAQSPFTPCLPGIADLTGVRVESQALQDLLVVALGQATGWRIELVDWTGGERRIIEALLPRYCSLDWNSRR
jgi:lipoate-protein ligase A